MCLELYSGQWKCNLKDGEGIMKYANGSVYEGQFKDDKVSYFHLTYFLLSIKQHGKGNLSSDEGVYEGFWREGKRDGEGSMSSSDGTRYFGKNCAVYVIFVHQSIRYLEK